MSLVCHCVTLFYEDKNMNMMSANTTRYSLQVLGSNPECCVTFNPFAANRALVEHLECKERNFQEISNRNVESVMTFNGSTRA